MNEYSRFTPLGVGAIIVLTLLAALMWIWFAAQLAYIERPATRAISAEASRLCAAMPRGNQLQERARHDCFNRLYDGRVRIEGGGA